MNFKTYAELEIEAYLRYGFHPIYHKILDYMGYFGGVFCAGSGLKTARKFMKTPAKSGPKNTWTGISETLIHLPRFAWKRRYNPALKLPLCGQIGGKKMTALTDTKTDTKLE